MIIATLLFIIVTILWIYFLWSRRKYYAFALKIPGPIGLPILGIVLKVIRMEEILYQLPKYAYEYNTKTYFTWLGPYPLLYTMEPKVAKILLNSADCINKSVFYRPISDTAGYGILTMNTPEWNKHRNLFNPSFSHKTSLNFFPNFNKFSRELCEVLDEQIKCGEVNIKQLVFNLSLKSAMASTMGLYFEQKSDLSFVDYFERAVEMTTHRALRPWLQNSTLFRFTSMYKPFNEGQTIITNFINELIVKRIKIFEQQEKESQNKPNLTEESVDIEKVNNIFIDQAIRIHKRNEIEFKDIAEEAKVMVFAAFDTTAITLFSTLMCLAMHPEYQEKVFEEIVTVFPKDEFDVSYEDFKNLVYLDMCINETLRVVATVPLIARECTNDVAISKDKVIPKGTQIAVDILSIHRDEEIWGPNAKTFNPDHFLPTNISAQQRDSFMPFSKGPRNCIGWQYAVMVLKVVLVHILRKYRLSTKFRFEDLIFVENITMKYAKLPHLEVEKRQELHY